MTDDTSGDCERGDDRQQWDGALHKRDGKAGRQHLPATTVAIEGRSDRVMEKSGDEATDDEVRYMHAWCDEPHGTKPLGTEGRGVDAADILASTSYVAASAALKFLGTHGNLAATKLPRIRQPPSAGRVPPGRSR